MEKLKGENYDGPSGIARDSMWLGSEDLIQGRDQKVSIESVRKYANVQYKGGKGPEQKKEVVLSLKFVGKARELGLNRTNTKILNKMFGNRTGGWVGKEISLYVTQCQAFGQTVDCVRIRDTGSRAATIAEQFISTKTEDPEVIEEQGEEIGSGRSMFDPEPGEAE